MSLDPCYDCNKFCFYNIKQHFKFACVKKKAHLAETVGIDEDDVVMNNYKCFQ